MAQELLTKEQIAVLEKIGSNHFLSDQFYLTGGTPLAAFYLRHRFSEDLDFFSEDEVDASGVRVFFETVKKDLGITKVDFEQSFNRNLFFLYFSQGTLKVEFTHFPFPRIEKGIEKYGVRIDSLLDIAVNKLFTIYQRTQARDYIDLYLICRDHGHTVRDLLKQAKIKFDWHIDPIQLGAQFIKAKETSDLPRMIKEVESKEWHDFFIAEAKKLRPDILE